ncbi:MAG: anhydro-N-acetylmuramic acid kinase [Gammaproteobacteria bacterium]|nr:anhydro-N-acetylmuramic acid kinase [Gammaproteobacteria bacterium]
MSGTSVDGIDAVLADFSEPKHRVIGFHSHPWPAAVAERIRAISVPGQNEIDRLGILDADVADAFAASALALLRGCSIDPDQIMAIGSHGQTIRHRPALSTPFTLQIGDPNRIAERTGICVVSDFRRRDMAAGGQGAPLAPAYHAALFSETGESRVILNIGGIANITLLPARPGAPILGFDTGPGNTLINTWIQDNLSRTYDRSGAWAAGGRVIPDLLADLKSDPYFTAPIPKTTGPEYFSRTWLEGHLRGRWESATPQDIQTTLTALTAESIADAIYGYAPDSSRVIVCGGGIHNNVMMRLLQDKLGSIPLESSQLYGINPEQVEAVAFAWLARQTINGQCGNLPSVTGARHPVILGGIYPGRYPTSSNGWFTHPELGDGVH